MERMMHAAMRVAVFEGHTMSDAALVRVARGASEVVALTSAAGNDLAARWSALLPHTPLIDGGFVRDLRQAMTEAARRGIGQIAIATPRDAARTLGFGLQGAASGADLDVPSMAIRIVRNADGGRGVALFTDTGEPSGYATVFALGLAELDGTEVMSLASKHLARPRRGTDKLTRAIDEAEPGRAMLLERTASDPLEAVLAEDFAVAVHGIIDVRVGGDLLGAQELGSRTFEGANVRRLLRLIEEFRGDVVVVLDGVRLLHGRRRAQRTAAGVGMEFGALAGIAYASAAGSEPAMSESAAEPRRGTPAGGFNIPELADEVPPALIDGPAFVPAARVPLKSSALRYPDQVVVRVADDATVLVTNPTREPLRVFHVASPDEGGGPVVTRDLGTVPIGGVDRRLAIPDAGVGPAVSRAIAAETIDGTFSVELRAESGVFTSGAVTHEHVPPLLLPERPVASPQSRYDEREVVEPTTLVVPDITEADRPVLAPEPEPEFAAPVELAPEPEPEFAAPVELAPEPEPELAVTVRPEPELETGPTMNAVQERPRVEVSEPIAREAIGVTPPSRVPLPPGAMFDPTRDTEPLPTPREGNALPAAREATPPTPRETPELTNPREVTPPTPHEAPEPTTPREPMSMPIPRPFAQAHAERGGRAIGMSRRERRLAHEAAQLQEQATRAHEV